MEGSTPQNPQGERSRPPPFPRANSRSSTSSSRTRMTTQTSSSSIAHTPSSPGLSAAPSASHSHRYHHSSCNRSSTTDRPRSRLSRESSEDIKKSQLPPPVSSFLMERLEKERKAEAERSYSRADNESMSSSMELRGVQSSPIRAGTSDGRRPRSSGGGGGDSAKKKGLGAREMESTLSTLHKQNFDLKLELFHRREKQTELEARLEVLEAEKAECDSLNDTLLAELEKRDRAVEEAVAMIMALETAQDELTTRVTQLLREREMVRQIEVDGYFSSRAGSSLRADGADLTPKKKAMEVPASATNSKTVTRMPSFLSERSEHTSHLRDVYLGALGSVLSLPRLSEDARDREQGDPKVVASPSMSVLSESSFLSIYGDKNATGSSSPPDDSHTSLDGFSDPTISSRKEAGSDSITATPTKARRNRGPSNASAQIPNINDVLDETISPLQRLEKMEKALSAMNDASRPSSQDKIFDARPASTQPGRRPKTKQEKREALEKVLTSHSLARDVGNPHALPPTPDTISTSTLRRFKGNSNDTLSQQHGLSTERSYLALTETTASQVSAGPERDGVNKLLVEPTAQPAALSAFDSRKDARALHDGYDDRVLGAGHPPRPRSADETTISHRRAQWDGDSSDDEFNDADSNASSFDYWMRESVQLRRKVPLDPMSSVSQAGAPTTGNGRASPDLFSFPTATGGWASDAMFGTLGGSGFSGTGGLGLQAPLAQTLDALGESLPTPLFGSGLATPTGANAPPPPPNRRSSLHARTGSTSAVIGSGVVGSSAAPRLPPANGRLRKSPERRGSRARSNSIDGPRPASQSQAQAIGQTQVRSPTAPPSSQRSQPPPPSTEQQPKRHYPPTASQASRPRGFNNLFRRSTGSADGPQTLPMSAPATETTFKNVPNTMVGVPSWGKRADLADDDRASATPPPIMRKRVTGQRSFDGGASLEGPASGGAPVGDIPGSAQDQLQIQIPPRTSGSGGGGGGGAILTPATPGGSAAAGGSAANTPTSAGGGAGARNDGKRRWLGLGRVGSLRKGAA